MSCQVSIPWRYRNQWLLSSLNYVTLKGSEPSSSRTRFSGLISLCMIFLLWTYSNPETKQAMKNPKHFKLTILTCLFLGKSSVLANMVAEVSTIEDVHYKVQVLSILEGIVHVDNERVMELGKDLSFVHYWLYAALRYDPRLRHLLHCILLLCFLSVNLPHLSETSFANAILIVEIVLSKSYIKI